VAVHHAPLRLAQALLADTRVEVLDHRGRPVGGEHLRSKPCGRQAETARPGRDVEEPLARLEPDEAERLVREIDFLWSHVPVVAGRDGVPGPRRRGVLVHRGCFVLTHGHRLLFALRISHPTVGGERRSDFGRNTQFHDEATWVVLCSAG
jgi:hypothetical protein